MIVKRLQMFLYGTTTMSYIRINELFLIFLWMAPVYANTGVHILEYVFAKTKCLWLTNKLVLTANTGLLKNTKYFLCNWVGNICLERTIDPFLNSGHSKFNINSSSIQRHYWETNVSLLFLNRRSFSKSGPPTYFGLQLLFTPRDNYWMPRWQFS